ncbi:hypothetical protein FA15DRAFT_739317 [Coprinopsis marcescibilis]|uniref:Fe2OG dioxygenase domain-containing protein n=1 Tax=Coprinopsis marcescibilis TaxID=230819 RepID=A0A5C3KX78_COPMA|nr:hypothetical protein FA15DRAFT_739317 [Coprinopsis marcescibilis]
MADGTSSPRSSNPTSESVVDNSSSQANQASDSVVSSAVSKKSATIDLGDDLSSALGDDFDFMGKFYYARTYPTLEVEDPLRDFEVSYIGEGFQGKNKEKYIRLPITTTQAKWLVDMASRAGFGKGQEKVFDPSVRDTWEISGSDIMIKGRRYNGGDCDWNAHLRRTVLKDVCKGLGVMLTETSPRLQLSKLLIYEPGGHFLPHRDTQKADGMFASVVLVLPCEHTGGQVHVTHAGSTEIIDIASRTGRVPSVLAWYTDVLHEVKPVTSGYRIALAYNLIYTMPNGPAPVFKTPNPLTDDLKTERLRNVLERWSKDEYPPGGVQPFFAYVLNHDYSPRELVSGVQCMKGSDAHKVALLRPIAEQLGFELALANLTYKRNGESDDNYRLEDANDELIAEIQAADDYSSDDEYETWEDEGRLLKKWDGPVSIINIEKESYSLSRIVDLHGNYLLREQQTQTDAAHEDRKPQSPGYLELENGEDVILPRGALQDSLPDEAESKHEGFWGNEPGDVTHWYSRSVLIIYRKRDEANFISTLESEPHEEEENNSGYPYY